MLVTFPAPLRIQRDTYCSRVIKIAPRKNPGRFFAQVSQIRLPARLMGEDLQKSAKELMIMYDAAALLAGNEGALADAPKPMSDALADALRRFC